MEENVQVQVQDNSPTIDHILRPISYTSWLFGVGVARPREYSRAITIIVRFVHLVACTVYMVYGITRIILFGSAVTDTDIMKFTYSMCMMTLFVSSYYNIYFGIRHYDKWPKLMDRIKELDQEIRNETSINNQPVKIVEALAIVTTFVWCPLFQIAHVLIYNHTNPENINVSDILFYYMVAQSLINNFVFDIVVYLLYYRFRTINNVICRIKFNKLSDASRIVFKIKRIRKLHNSICHLVNMVNDIHGYHLLFCSANCFCMIVTTLFIIYTNIVRKNYAYICVNNIVWIQYAVQFGLMCWICSLTRQESDKIGESLCEIVLNSKPMSLDKVNEAGNKSSLEMRSLFVDSEQSSNRCCSHNRNYVALEKLLRKNMDRDSIRNEINDFIIQLQQYRVTFTARDFFKMNNGLFTKFVEFVITYLVIFIQFYQPPEDTTEVKRPMKIF
ncbi:uncharacterized protein LOC113003079 [Solenopsis invicta]|uniref:uncharacterized protein LOC113003079 n=1 Tax=Solenopsis invicta TaxID=13686 RepID=UPI000E33D768|nr:uncharacterized protein LOC113003079 [Solenopsis invicta]